MDYKKEYERWLQDPAIDEATRQELQSIATNDKETEDRFYTYLAFGTAGMRGVIGAGANRMNIYTVRKATQGLANYILAQGTEKKGVVIAYDCRRMSPEFCEEAALVLNGNGIHTYVFDSLRPTPELSFAVRHLNCTAGIVITASHNPSEYNGYKVYWDDGGQVPYPRDYAIIEEVNKVTDFSQIKVMDRVEAEKANLFRIAGPDVDTAYIQAVLKERRHPELAGAPLKIVFTPLHGTGYVPVQRVLAEAGYENVHIVEKQAQPDGNFPTISSPNPEDYKAFALSEELALETDADIMLCTDPDADRMGVAVRVAKGKYIPFNGNMTGALLTEYILSQDKASEKLSENDVVISTIVSTDMTRTISEAYGVTYMEVLTGFKYFGEKIKEFEQSGNYKYVFGFEESYGCLAGDHARDKDAVEAVLLLCEAAAFYAKENKTLWDVMVDTYKKYGFYKESIESITLKGVEGLADIRRIMTGFRENPPKDIGGVAIIERRDYQEGQIVDCITGNATVATLPKSDVMYYVLEDGSWVCIRPSGTEPKIKLYFGTLVKEWSDVEEANQKADEKLSTMTKILKERCM
ncbi:MAG: phospho-sugar mutase [Defluviitaleaceae bacterium]|nr:phospho-sugar mutase [Defluviitaleaceae bacterium]